MSPKGFASGCHLTGRSKIAILFVWLATAAFPASATIEFVGGAASALKSSGTVSVYVARSGAAEGATAVRVLVTHGTAVQGQDYSGGNEELQWGAGETGSKAVTLTLISDGGLNEGPKTVDLALTSVSEGETLGQDTKEITILDNPANNDDSLLPEQKQAAVAIDAVCNGSANTPAASSCVLFQSLDDRQQQDAIESILPRYVTQQTASAATAQLGNSQAVHQRMEMVRGGVHNSIAGLQLNIDGESVPLQAMLDEIGPLGGNAGDELLDDKWGFFASGRISRVDQDSTKRDLGYLSDGKQITLGLDYRFTPDFFAGTAINYSINNVETNDDGGKQDSKSTLISLFGSYYFAGSFYVDTLLTYGVSSYDTDRKIRLGDKRIRLDSSADGTQLGMAATLGYDKSIDAWQFGTYLRAEADHYEVDAYDETGDDAFALAIDKQKADSQQTAIGVSGSYVYPVSYGVWIPKLTIEWIQELKDDERKIDAHFVNSPESDGFTIVTTAPDSSYYNVGWSIAGTFSGGRSAFLRYDIQIDRKNYASEIVELGARIPF